nr:MAG TPA: hypothetical protein [Caudoviricetes sp.]
MLLLTCYTLADLGLMCPKRRHSKGLSHFRG